MLGFSTVIQIIRIEDLIRILVTKSKVVMEILR